MDQMKGRFRLAGDAVGAHGVVDEGEEQGCGPVRPLQIRTVGGKWERMSPPWAPVPRRPGLRE